MQKDSAYITLEGLAPDIAGLSKVFPLGNGSGLIVEPPAGVKIIPEASGNGFKVDRHELVRTTVHGDAVREALKASKTRFKPDALENIANRLNAAGCLCDPEFKPVKGTSWGIGKPGGGSSWGIPENSETSYRTRTSLGRIPQHQAMAHHAAHAVSNNETAERVLYLLNTNPGWVGLNIILEAIAWHESVTPETLHTINLAPNDKWVKAFKNTANNARDLKQDPRHEPKPSGKTNKQPKISLWEARITVKRIVFHWIDHLPAT